ncbi:hypothetical protein TSAR_006362 [Trichomalopsis sarcophagae]|uniref:Ubiquitin-related modifier 1 n=1 Tax=Trichomalopsis sarcophagae TaxID=543379 RepID=A0A232EYK7_9HYME|nr:hypothetical protein TSAR_006362 [Trichomalopsis sarcophagae]
MTGKEDGLPLTVEFGGGAELLFGNIKKHSINLPAGKQCKMLQESFYWWSLRELILWMKENMLKERPELFVQDNTV